MTGETPHITKVNYLNLAIIYGAAIVSAYLCSIMVYEWRYDVLGYFAKAYMKYYDEVWPQKAKNEESFFRQELNFDEAKNVNNTMVVYKNSSDLERNSTSQKASNQSSQKNSSNQLSGSQWRNSAPASSQSISALQESIDNTPARNSVPLQSEDEEQK